MTHARAHWARLFESEEYIAFCGSLMMRVYSGSFKGYRASCRSIETVSLDETFLELEDAKLAAEGLLMAALGL